MKEVQLYAGPTMISAMQAAVVLNQTTTIPLPTDEDWRQAVAKDHNLSRIVQALKDGPLTSLTKAELVEKAYFEEWKQERLVVDDGIVCRYKVCNRASFQQLHTCVVPPPLRRTIIIVACHASPMAGHSGVIRTMYRVITRFWWPYVARDIINGMLGCVTCPLANHNSHEAQMHLYAFTCDEPFSMIFLDMWKPVDVPEKDGTREVLTMMDGMPAFAAGASLGKPITAEVLADVTFSQFSVSFASHASLSWTQTVNSVASSPKPLRTWASTWKWSHVRTTRPFATNASIDTSTESSKSTQQQQDRSFSESKA
jgi:hypothetical protein